MDMSRKSDPLARAAQSAFRKTDLYRLEKLLTAESRWKRKRAIASNKLAQVREKINELALELANPKGPKLL